MTLTPIKANMTELELDGMRVLFSYRTPVAALVREETAEGASWHQYRTEKRWSNTTTGHINTWNPLGGAYGLKPQEFFDSLGAGVK
jgi:hypothetical protein